MTDITPPRELVTQWMNDFYGEGSTLAPGEFTLYISNRAAQWGYQQAAPFRVATELPPS